MNGFIRATHENGVCRNLPEWKNNLFDYDYIHFLGDKPMTLYAICKAVETYNKMSSVNMYYNYPDKLMGNDKPLAFDNAALTSLFRDCLTYIQELEKENIELKRENLVKTYALGYVNNPIDYAIKTLEDVSNLIGQDKQVLFSILALREYQQDLDNANFQNR